MNSVRSGWQHVFRAVLFTSPWLCLVLCGKSLNAYGAEPATPHDQTLRKIEGLVEDLGHVQYVERQRANTRLLELGVRARPALTSALQNQDLEIRFQSRRILSAIDKNEFFRQLQNFVETDVAADTYHFPGWSQYRQLVGSDRRSKRLFVEMQKAEPQLLHAYADHLTNVGGLLWERCVYLKRVQSKQSIHRESLTIGRIAALLLIAGDETVPGRQRAANDLSTLCYHSSVRQAMGEEENQRAMRKIIGAWIRTIGLSAYYQAFRLAMHYDLRDGLVPAERALRIKAQSPRMFIQYALLTVGKLGEPHHIPLVETHLKDKTRCANHSVKGVKYRTETCDIALACLFHLAGEDPKQMGFPILQRERERLFVSKSLGFANEEQRQAALQKWQSIRQQQSLAEKILRPR